MAGNTFFPAFSGLVLQADSRQSVDNEGLVTIQANYLGLLSIISSVGAAYGTSHPYYPLVGVDTSSVDPLGDGVLGFLRITYKGVYAAGSVRYELQRTATSIPVEQCADFLTVATDANGAVFDDDGTFKGWKASSPYAGIMAVAAPQFAVTETQLLTGPDTTGTVGKLTGIPGPFGLPSGIFMGASSTQLGGLVWRNVKTWQTMIVPKLSDQVGG